MLDSGSSQQVSIWNFQKDQAGGSITFAPDQRYWFTPDGRFLILYRDDQSGMQIWQTESGRLVASINTPPFHPRADMIFAVSNDVIIQGEGRDFYVWSVASGKLLYAYHGPTPFAAPAIISTFVDLSPDGKYLRMVAGNNLPSIEGDTSDTGVLAIWRLN